MINHLKSSIEASLAIMKSEVQSTDKAITVDNKTLIFNDNYIYVDGPEGYQKIILDNLKLIGVAFGHQDITFNFIDHSHRYIASIIINASQSFDEKLRQSHIEKQLKGAKS